MSELWAAYNRLWGRCEAKCRGGIRYVESFSDGLNHCGIYSSELDQVQVKRAGSADFAWQIPRPAEDSVLLSELCVIAHELAHAENRRRDERRWVRYFTALTQWSVLRNMSNGPPLDPAWADEILWEEGDAEFGGALIISAMYPPAQEEFQRRAAASLAAYRKWLKP